MTSKSKPNSPTSISEEDFDSWKTNTITQTFLKHLATIRERAQQMWIGELAATAPADPIFLAYLKIELKSKLEFIEDIEALSLEDIQPDHAAENSQRELGVIARQAANQGKLRH